MAARASKKTLRRAVPGYLKHRSGQARVVLNGKTFYLGLYGSPESHERYGQLIREWERNDRRTLVDVPHASEAGTTIASLADAYWSWIEATSAYRKKGAPTSAHARVKKALDKLRDYAGTQPVRTLTKQALVVFRDQLCSRPHRTVVGINKTIQIIKRMANWGAERGFVQDTQATILATLAPLREAPRKKAPVPLADLTRVIEELDKTAPTVADMVRVQFLLGCRPGEVREMRWKDIDREGLDIDDNKFWVYTVTDGKTDKETYPISPEAQQILARYPRRNLTDPIFSPRVKCASPQRPDVGGASSSAYGRCEYLRCVRRATERANVRPFGVHQIRHTSLSLVANDSRGGLGAAAALGNHASQATTARFYASVELGNAVVGAKLLQQRLQLVTSDTHDKHHAHG